jgi:hypothetical protein
LFFVPIVFAMIRQNSNPSTSEALNAE